MEFWASAEVHQPAFAALEKTRRNVEPFLNAAFAASILASLECTLRHIPIVMPKDMHARYPARSKLRKKQCLYDCAPLLDYDAFVNGQFADQLREYIRGIALSSPYLADLGASSEQIEAFDMILESAADRILIEQPSETRH